MGRRILIASGKGGVGKTTISVGLGEALSRLGASVCVVDLDFDFNNLDVVAGIESKLVYSLEDFCENKCLLKQTLIEYKRGLNLFFVLSSRACAKEEYYYKLREAIRKLSDVFDYVLMDAPAGLSSGFYIGKEMATEVIMVVCPMHSSLKDSNALKNILFSENLPAKIVVNKIRGDLVMLDKMLNVSQIEGLLGLECAGVVPYSDEFLINNNTKSVAESSEEIKKAMHYIAENIHLNKNLRLDYCNKYKGIFGKIRAKIKRGA